MRIKTSELTGPALDWAVATAEGHKPPLLRVQHGDMALPQEDDPMYCDYLKYSTDWAQGGPIIGKIKGFQFKQWLKSKPESCCEAHIHNYDGDWVEFGPTPLVAAMRCYVASKLGDVVNVPGQLTK